jgi:hypothetical protein
VSQRILSIAESVVGACFAVEDTGGGWRCHVARLEGGPVLVLSDGMGGAEYEELGYLCAGLYANEEQWADSGCEAIGYADTVAVDNDGSIRRVVTDAVDTIRCQRR